MPLDGSIIYGKDVTRLDGTHSFLVGTRTSLYYYDGTDATQIGTGFNTSVHDRWQGAFLDGDFFLVNNFDAPQRYQGTTILTPLAGDSSMPQTARFIVNITGHLMFLNTVEGAVRNPQRVRWSDIDQPDVYVPTDTNEANFLDLGETPGEIMGAALLGPQQVVVYKNDSVYLLSYSGRPTVFDVRRVITDEGLFAPYSLVAFRDSHFLLGNNDFYRCDGNQFYPLGVNRVRDTVFNQMQKQAPENFYGYAHPEFPEIWWVYMVKDSTLFGKAIVYNFEQDVWTTRNIFPFSMLAEKFDTSSATFDKATITYDLSTLTFDQKKVAGSFATVGGDDNGELFELGRVTTADGANLQSTIDTADFIQGSTPTYLNRVNLAMSSTGSAGGVAVAVMARKEFDSVPTIRYAALYDGTPQIDTRVIDNFIGLHIRTYEFLKMEGFTFVSKPAGGRV